MAGTGKTMGKGSSFVWGFTTFGTRGDIGGIWIFAPGQATKRPFSACCATRKVSAGTSLCRTTFASLCLWWSGGPSDSGVIPVDRSGSSAAPSCFLLRACECEEVSLASWALLLPRSSGTGDLSPNSFPPLGADSVSASTRSGGASPDLGDARECSSRTRASLYLCIWLRHPSCHSELLLHLQLPWTVLRLSMLPLQQPL